MSQLTTTGPCRRDIWHHRYSFRKETQFLFVGLLSMWKDHPLDNAVTTAESLAESFALEVFSSNYFLFLFCFTFCFCQRLKNISNILDLQSQPSSCIVLQLCAERIHFHWLCNDRSPECRPLYAFRPCWHCHPSMWFLKHTGCVCFNVYCLQQPETGGGAEIRDPSLWELSKCWETK